MRKRDHDADTIGAAELAELDAIDAALSGAAVAEEHARLATLTSSLQAARPRPRDEFVRSLDARAAQGFARHRRRLGHRSGRTNAGSAVPVPRGASRRGRLAGALNHRAVALGAVVLLAAAIVVPLGVLSVRSAPHGSANSAAGPARGVQLGAPRSAPASGAAASPEAASPEAAPRAKQNALGASAAPGARLVEQTASLDVGVAPAAVQQTAQRVFTLAGAFHGYVQQSNVSSGSGEGGASFTLRLPSANVTAAVAALAHLGHVRSENETSNDVTEAHASLERSLGDARAERASLLAQLSRAVEPERIESLKAQLRAVEARLAGLESSLHALDSRVDFTNIALSLTPERQQSVSAGALTPGGALHDAGGILVAGLAVLVLAAAVLVPLGVVAGAASLGLAGARRRLREQALDAS
jgi:hypothetical protein